MTTSSKDNITEMLRAILESSDEAVEVLTDLLRRGVVQVADFQHSVDTVKKRRCANKTDVAAESCNTFTAMAASCQPRSSTRVELVGKKRSNEVKQIVISNSNKEIAGIPSHVHGNSSSSIPDALDEESLDSKWIVRLKQFQAHKSKHGNCDFSISLGRWVKTQHNRYHKFIDDRPSSHYTTLVAGNPSFQTIKRLDALNNSGFEWKMPKQVDWFVRFEEFRQHKEKHGNCNFPIKFAENPKLSNWVITQRQAYKRFCSGKESSLNEERVEALNTLGFNWSVVKRVDWDVRLEELRQYKAKYGDCNVPSTFPDDQKLAQWVRSQRTHYKTFCLGKTSPMNEERVKALNSLGFTWSMRYHLLIRHNQNIEAG